MSNNKKKKMNENKKNISYGIDHTCKHLRLRINAFLIVDYIVSIISSIFKIDRTVSVAKRIALTETSNG